MCGQRVQPDISISIHSLDPGQSPQIRNPKNISDWAIQCLVCCTPMLPGSCRFWGHPHMGIIPYVVIRIANEASLASRKCDACDGLTLYMP